MLHPGDKVSFINEKQDGVVIAIKPDGTIVVEIEDGFTLDATSKELVLIKSMQKGSIKPNTPELKKEIIVIPDYNLVEDLALRETVSVVAIPTEEKITGGDINYHLVNGTVYEILYVFSSRIGKLIHGYVSGQLKSGESIKLGSFSRSQLIEIEQFKMEILFFKSGTHASIQPINKEFSPVIPTLHQSFPKAPSPLSYSILHSLVNLAFEPEPDLKELMKKYKDDIGATSIPDRSLKNETAEKKPDTAFRDFGITPIQSEIDLHIEELVDDPSGMIASEMITIQLNHFRKALDRALLSRGGNIVFIHGIGNGRLKNAIRTELNGLNIRFKDGAYDRYGAGATEVILR